MGFCGLLKNYTDFKVGWTSCLNFVAQALLPVLSKYWMKTEAQTRVSVPHCPEQSLDGSLFLVDRRDLSQARYCLWNHFDCKIDIFIRGLLAQADANTGSRSLMWKSHRQQHM